MCGFQNCCEQEREENPDALKQRSIRRDVLHHPGNGYHLSENAARRGNEKNRTNRFQSLIGDIIKMIYFMHIHEKPYSKQCADGKCNNRRPKEITQLCTKTRPLRHRSDGAKSHQKDWNNDWAKRKCSIWQPTIFLQNFIVCFDDFSVSRFHIRFVCSPDFFADVTCIKICSDQRRNGNKRTQSHDQKQVVADPKRICRCNRARCWRDKYMGSIKAARQADRHGNAAFAGTLHQSPADWIQNNESAVAEDRDRNDPPHDQHSHIRVIRSDHMNYHVSELKSSSRLFQNCSDQCAENNNNADAGEGAAEAGPDYIGKSHHGGSIRFFRIDQRNPRDQAQQQRNDHNCQERMDFQLRDCQNHGNDRDNECYD